MTERSAVDIITEVLTAHRLGIRQWADGFRHTSCMCPVEVGATCHPQHVAAEVVKALGGLNLEWAIQLINSHGTVCDTTAPLERETVAFAVGSERLRPVSRFVGGWTPQEPADA